MNVFTNRDPAKEMADLKCRSQVVRRDREAVCGRKRLADRDGSCTLVYRRLTQPTRILLADDEIDLWWEKCLSALARSGYHVDTAEDGEAAWEAAQTNDYDLLIADNKMPKLWGLDLIIKLRAQGMALPIILASSLLPTIPPEQKPYFVNVHLLEKPVTPSQLLATIGFASHGFQSATHSLAQATQ
jgi:DNA-binding response OmpR family regulator